MIDAHERKQITMLVTVSVGLLILTAAIFWWMAVQSFGNP
jgi:nitrogen fixation-related uncharacterized protein